MVHSNLWGKDGSARDSYVLMLCDNLQPSAVCYFIEHVMLGILRKKCVTIIKISDKLR